jgi:riboflavin synthase
MFTGIIQAIGTIIHLQMSGSILKYAVQFPSEMLPGLRLGASVSVGGICQTVIQIDGDLVWFEAISETLERTTLKALQKGQTVNLERSARLGDEIGGHLLSGHIYGEALVSAIEKNIYHIRCPLEWMKYFFAKGFIAIDGISLTVVEVYKSKGIFTVHLIPETLSRTTLSQKKVGDKVNIEIDTVTQTTVETVFQILQSE